jgi:hypothetical protein
VLAELGIAESPEATSYTAEELKQFFGVSYFL